MHRRDERGTLLGLALLVAKQNIGFLAVATRVVVLEVGCIGFSGTVAEMNDTETASWLFRAEVDGISPWNDGTKMTSFPTLAALANDLASGLTTARKLVEE